MKHSIQISATTLVSGMGIGLQAHIDALKTNSTALKKQTNSFETRLDSYFAEVVTLNDVELPTHLNHYRCRNNQLAWLALQTDGFREAIQRVRTELGSTRIGIAVGTSTSGILETERALAVKATESQFPKNYHYQSTHEMDALANFCAESLEIEGPRIVISTACSSSAKVFATASRWIDAGIVDAMIVGGVDTLCLTTLHGFKALGLISSEIVQPMDENRQGINIGEAGGFMLLEKASATTSSDSKIRFSGYGESSDAYHISTPHPNGHGARNAMSSALKMAQLNPEDINYLNLHGTGTPSNDLSESHAVRDLFTNHLPLHSSTKGFTGHTLGAAGITEAIFCQLALEHQTVFANLNLNILDSTLGLDPVRQSHSAQLSHCMTNSFGFGGNNASLIFSLAEESL